MTLLDESLAISTVLGIGLLMEGVLSRREILKAYAKPGLDPSEKNFIFGG